MDRIRRTTDDRAPADPGRADDATEEIHLGAARTDPEDARAAGPLRSFWTRASAPRSPALVYAGVVSMALGFALTAFTWGRVAGVLSVPLQMPYVASGGLTAIGLVALGSALVATGTARRDAARREARMEELGAVLRAIREAVEER
ncbi:MAG TPA: hypothetical protein VM840_06310 [Actinomycetota bacterium]|nr:hypothetical protein [Actinomycetota bacterium]